MSTAASPPLSAPESRALDALLELADAHPERAVSARQLAARLGCTNSTAWWHRERLVRKGYIRLVERGPREAAAVWQTRQRRPDIAYGFCTRCGLERALDTNGLLPVHRAGRRGPRRCPGSGLAPEAVA